MGERFRKNWPTDRQTGLYRIFELIEEFGPEQVREPYVKHLDGKLWEMRIKGRDGIARTIYVALEGKRIVILNAFRKKTQKTPQQTIRLARKRLKELLS
uniref:Phage derived protein Gp49-like (DUF891) n=1 Tax=Candidatus Kentrum sp. DK TaxID=2126562 RepID=A0A450S880_9GAMM|nr:MAG: Phage derived protein Gp49-like (DUF891) [Candidatus Kentron sp. DK]VFJ48077.1 MAG: Phage derived protein Gp49-like (DUF891) [Candidatus Kentron sp. DK]